MIMFVDEAKIFIKAGDGGNGCASFHREKFVPRGGPNGGDGGRGGNIVLQADEGLRTLLDFQWRRHHKAERGRHGQGSNRHGAGGEDLILKVPIGTIAREEDGPVIGELISPGQSLVIAAGGLGGRGNTHFVTPVKKAPKFAERGEPGEEKTILLELKLLADVGLVGYPNAGKSTLISRVSAARPKIAAYPFTTLKPNLGVVRLDDDRSFVIADIPGLIEGAHQGKGLGDRFLRHLERTAVLLHLIDLSGQERPDPLADFKKVETELKSYGAGLAERPAIVVGTKIDLPESEKHLARARRKFAKSGQKFIAVSAVTGEGIDELLYETAALVGPARAERSPELVSSVRVYRFEPREELQVERVANHAWRVINTRAERMVRMTDFTNDEAVDYLRSKLTALGLDDRLAEEGAVAGDEVTIAEMAFEYREGPHGPGETGGPTEGKHHG